MKKPKKILLISLIAMLVLWFGGNLGLYLFAKHFLIGEDRLELFNKVPETIEIKYKGTGRQTIYFGDVEFSLPLNDYSTLEIFPDVYIDNNSGNEYIVSMILSYKFYDNSKTLIIHMWNPDQKLAEGYIKSSHYTFDHFSLWNIPQNIQSIKLIILKWITLPSNSNVKRYPLSIVNTEYFKGFLKTSSENKTILSSFDFSIRDKSYSIMLPGNNRTLVIDTMKDIISSIKPIEDIEKVAGELTSNYKNEAVMFEKELALISLISIEGPNLDNLSELKKLLIQKGEREKYIEDVQEQIDILKGKLEPVSTPPQN